ncbi:hypothetical protein L0B70_07865 [Kaistella sp. 97-N-M2]|uniref:hypothetical protein n=1 Tax=Kaistella sp. 97-N-M2 TaxID=2908645 RepID=UPI001F20EDE6|nr:hypothetical protein [Kaistella sp. 97-N-M2]UJF28784.1 hypothetical protein L0B70_07865 [Kaistella sp. 97-N-M2]
MRKVVRRVQEPTPKFFRKIRNFGLILTGIGGAIVTAPVVLPAVVTTAAGYAALAGAIASIVSQTAVANDRLR